MNKKIDELGLEAGLLNYIDHETPREVFIHGHADLDDVHRFAELIVKECLKVMDKKFWNSDIDLAMDLIRQHFGVE